jgi:thymidylate synthase
MMEMKNQNNIEHQYLKLLKDILDNGTEKETRNGKTLSVFGRQIRHDMKLGFPLLTTKKMYWKGIVTELLWFLRGDTNIKYLVDNDCHIWNGDAYENYLFNSDWHPISSVNGGFIGTKTDSDEIMTQELFINKIKTDDEFAKKWGDLGPIYGKQWRSWYTRELMFRSDVVGEPQSLPEFFEVKVPIDQIANLINDLKTNPDSRRLLVSAWNPADLPHQVLPPCHYGFQVYTRELTWEEQVQWVMKNTDVEWENLYIVEEIAKDTTPKRAISLMWSQRSCDFPLGIPFNIASYALLLELLAKTTNMIPDELIGNLGDTHIYHNQVDGIKEQLTREPYQLPKLNINTEWWPTESGECGEGPIDAQAVLEGFSNDNFCKCLIEEDIQLGNYKYHPTIKMPLSN